MITASSGVKAQIGAASTSVIELLEVDFGGGLKRYWSNQQVLSNFFPHTAFEDDLQPWMFEPRILSIDAKEWKLLPDDSSLSVRIADSVVGYTETVRGLINTYGMDIFYSAVLHYHLLFPNLKSEDNILKNVWLGRGAQLSIEEDVVTWDIRFGLSSLLRKFGRKLDTTCPHVFADQYECTYNLENGRGFPKVEESKTLQGGSSNSQLVVDSTANLKVGMYAVNINKNMYARITNVVNSTTVSITVVFGTNTFASGDTVAFGFPYTSCPHTLVGCEERGRYAPAFGDKRTEFGGNAPAKRIEYRGKVNDEKFTRVRYAGETNEGKVVPVVYGNYLLQGVNAAWYAPAGNFIHALFYVCEGRIYSLSNPVVAGQPPDNIKVDTNNVIDVIAHESFWLWGVGTLEDDRIVDEKSLYWALNAVGNRKSIGVNSNVTLDVYGTPSGYDSSGGLLPNLIPNPGHPYLFNDKDGKGVSLDGLTVTRIRVEVDGDTNSSPSGEFMLIGRYVWIPAQAKKPASTFRYTVNSVDHYYTIYPNPALVALDILLNRRYGAGLDPSDINIDSFVAASDFCEEMLAEINITSTKFDVTVVHGPGDSGYVFGPNWAIIDTIFKTGELNGYRIKFPSLGFETLIINSRELPFIHGQPNLLNNYIPGSNYIDTLGFGYDAEGTLIFLRDTPPTPLSNGVTAVIEPAGEVARYKANGVISSDAKIGDVVDRVLEEMAADFRFSQDGKIEVVVRRALTYAEMQDILQNRYFTDRGAKRNIIRNDGKSSLRVWNEDVSAVPNTFRAEIISSKHKFTNVTLVVFSDEAQKQRALLFGKDQARDKLEESVEFILTTGVDQALRRLALRAREVYIQNLYCSFRTSIKDGLLIQPGDVIAIDSDIFGMFTAKPELQVSIGGAYFFRVLKKKLTERFECEFECQIHINDIYDDSATAFGDYFQLSPTNLEGDKAPADVIIVDVNEEAEVGADGTVFDFIVASFKFPV